MNPPLQTNFRVLSEMILKTNYYPPPPHGGGGGGAGGLQHPLKNILEFQFKIY